MSIEQHIPTTNWVESLERAIEICRDQIAFARAMNISKIAIPVDSLEKILDELATKEPE